MESVMAVDPGARRLVEIPRTEVTGGFDQAGRSGIGQLGGEVHGLADAGAVELQAAKLELHRLAAGIFAQDVELGVVGVDFFDDEVRQVSAMPGAWVGSAAAAGGRSRLGDTWISSPSSFSQLM